MAEPPRAPKLAIGEVIREAFATYRSYLWPLLAITVCVFGPVALVEAATGPLQELDPDEFGALAIVSAIGGALTFSATATLGDVFYTGVVAAVVAESRGGVRRELADVARHLPYLRLAAVDILFTLLVAIGLVALIVPGLMAFAWFVLAAPVVEIEGGGVRNAFRRSRELVRGSTGRILVLLMPVIVIGDAVGELLFEAVEGALGHGVAVEISGSVLAEALTAPFFALAAVVATHQLIALKRQPP